MNRLDAVNIIDQALAAANKSTEQSAKVGGQRGEGSSKGPGAQGVCVCVCTV